MKKNFLIQGLYVDKVEKNCPICGKKHLIELRNRMASTIIKGESVSYQEYYYVCTESCDEDNEFVDSKLNKKNLLCARNEYRKKKGLLTSDEIVAIREQYGLSQLDLANLLGWGEVTVSRYESKAIQDQAYDNILRSIKKNPLNVFHYFEQNQDKFTVEKQEYIKENVIKRLNEYGREYLSRQLLESKYVEYSEPSDFNGNMTLSIDMLERIISYFAQKVGDLYKVKLMKMLWYADVLSYQKYHQAMTGLVYIHNKMGALPIGHNDILELKNINVVEEENDDYIRYHFIPGDTIDVSQLELDERTRNILEEVVNKFQYYKTKEIVAYMHQEIAYQQTQQGDIIPFSLAKQIRKF